MRRPNEIELKMTDEAYDPVYGARPLKRFLQQHVETPVARKMIAGECAAGSTVKVEIKSGALAIL